MSNNFAGPEPWGVFQGRAPANDCLCPTPNENFFVSLALASSLVSSTPPLVLTDKIKALKLTISASRL